MHGSTGGFFLSHGAIGNHPKDGPFTYMDALCLCLHRLVYFSLLQDRLGVNQPGHHPAGAAFAGAAATVFHDAVMTPMDVVKQRLQLGYHKGMLDCMLTIGRTEGAQVGAGDVFVLAFRVQQVFLLHQLC